MLLVVPDWDGIFPLIFIKFKVGDKREKSCGYSYICYIVLTTIKMYTYNSFFLIDILLFAPCKLLSSRTYIFNGPPPS